MEYHFSLYRIAVWACVVLFACTKSKEDMDVSKYKYEYLYAKDVPFDSFPHGKLVSEFQNVKNLQFNYSAKFVVDQYNNDVELLFVDPNNFKNQITVKLKDFFPFSDNGIGYTALVSGLATRNSSDSQNVIGYLAPYTKIQYRRKSDGQCELLCRNLIVSTKNFFLPNNPKYFATIKLVFPPPDKE